MEEPYSARRERLAGLRAGRLEPAGARVPRGPRPRAAAGRHRAGPRGRPGQAHELSLQARQAHRRLAEDQAPRPPGVRRRGMGPRQGHPQPPHRRAAAGRLRERRLAALRRARRAAASASASSNAWPPCWSRWRARAPPSPAPVPRASRSSASPGWWPRCPSASGPRTGACATPSTSACARTSRHGRSCARTSPTRAAGGPRPGAGAGPAGRPGRERPMTLRRRRAADRAHPLGSPRRPRRRPRAEALQPRQGALPRERAHQGRADRLLRGRGAGAAAPPRRAPADRDPLAGRGAGQVVLPEAGARPTARSGWPRRGSPASASRSTTCWPTTWRRSCGSPTWRPSSCTRRWRGRRRWGARRAWSSTSTPAPPPP